LEEAARQGRLHVLDPGERGILVRFYVDEEPAEDLAGRRRGDAREGVLDVPTGRLFLASVEHLGNWNEAERTRADKEGTPPTDIEGFDIPPGRYRVRSFEV